MTPVASGLGGWETFCVIVGAAAGALIGLQFVVMTLIAERPPEKADEASAAFASPTVVHFSVVLFLAALFAVPWQTLWIVAQGAKSIMVGANRYEYDAEHMIVFSVDVPVASQVTQASKETPFLCLRLDLDTNRIADLVLKVFPFGLPSNVDKQGVSITGADVNILGAATRLVELTAHASDTELIAPLVIEEILIRLLRGPAGPKLAQMGVADSGVQGVAKAVSWLRSNFSQPVKVDALAAVANMSASSFHQHFKLVTSMSPLQYQKALRLEEARRLMLSSMMDAASASHRVGYQSPSQFSREYGRFFGSPPTSDIAKLREAMAAEEIE